MSDLELVLTVLAETTTTEISKLQQPDTLEAKRKVARSGGAVAGRARKDVEAQTGVPVITEKTAVDFTQLIDNIADVKPNKDEQ